MTYKEYNISKNKKNIFKTLFNKLFTVIIFSMLVVIISNYSPKFRNFIINDVLNRTMDFSKINKALNSFTTIFKNDNTISVSNIEENYEKYLDGVKYTTNKGSDVLLKSSGIVTFIGKKDGYNNTVIVQQSNGYYAWYGNIKESVKLYDYVEKGSVIGKTKSEEYYYALFKDGKKVDINEN